MEVGVTAKQPIMIWRLSVLQLIPLCVRPELSHPDSREGFVARGYLRRRTPPWSISDLLGVERRHASSWIHHLLSTRLFLSTSMCLLTPPECLSRQLTWLSLSCSGCGGKQQTSPGGLVRRKKCFLKLSSWAQMRLLWSKSLCPSLNPEIAVLIWGVSIERKAF